ncbi:MAG: hypothetical protein CFE23_16695 [Flavobacterium sp. BFFFF1]|nr:MAG: hypothetical protein CFE23_16695 [Flavobacterium sp. BFFFF1]
MHKNLSKSLDYQVSFERTKNDSCIISVTVIKKDSNISLQTVVIKSEFIFEKDFQDCAFTRSYTTHVNDDHNNADNQFEDFIVADFNFDGKEDFAVKRDSGGNGGSLYSYFIQNDNEKFELNDYLTNTMVYFPIIFNKKKLTLTTLVHANAYQRNRTIYKCDSKTTWKIVSEKLEN